jgi:hypothetical protein
MYRIFFPTTKPGIQHSRNIKTVRFTSLVFLWFLVTWHNKVESTSPSFATGRGAPAPPLELRLLPDLRQHHRSAAAAQAGRAVPAPALLRRPCSSTLLNPPDPAQVFRSFSWSYELAQNVRPCLGSPSCSSEPDLMTMPLK